MTPPLSAPGEVTAEQFARDDRDWERLHPLSPLVRGWVVVLAFVIAAGRNQIGDLFDLVRAGQLFDAEHRPFLLWTLAGFVGLVLVVLGGAYLIWSFKRYKITEDHVYLNQGVVTRKRQKLRLDRVQSIDVNQPLLARLVGLGELKFVTADGEDSFSLSYFSIAQARRLRSQLLERGADEEDGRAQGPEGSGQSAQSVVPSEGGEKIFVLPVPRVILSLLLSSHLVAVVLYLMVFGTSVLLSAMGVVWAHTSTTILLVSLGPALLGYGAYLFTELNKNFNFSIIENRHGLRVSSGLTSLTQKALRRERIHAVIIEQPLFWRPLGWCRVRQLLAGTGEDENESSVLLPVATMSEARTVLESIAPFAADHTAAFVREDSDGFLPMAKVARFFSPFERKRAGSRIAGNVLLTRRGGIKRKLHMVPMERVQSVSSNRGPIQRLLNLVTVEAHLVGGLDSGAYSPSLEGSQGMEFFERLRTACLEAAARRRLVLSGAGQDFAQPNPERDASMDSSQEQA